MVAILSFVLAVYCIVVSIKGTGGTWALPAALGLTALGNFVNLYSLKKHNGKGIKEGKERLYERGNEIKNAFYWDRIVGRCVEDVDRHGQLDFDDTPFDNMIAKLPWF